MLFHGLQGKTRTFCGGEGGSCGWSRFCDFSRLTPVTFDDSSPQLKKIFFFIFGCAGSSQHMLLHGLALVAAGGGSSSGVVCGLLIAAASHVAMPGFRAPAWQLCCTDFVAPRHVGSPQTRD